MKAGLLFLVAPFLFAQNGAVVEGTATNTVTHTGVPGVTITLGAATWPHKALYSAQSDSTGSFRITSVKEGVYVPSFDAPRGFIAPFGPDPLCKPLRVLAGSDPIRFDVPLKPLGALRGRVVDNEGRAVPQVNVVIFRVHGNSGDSQISDTEGRFYLENLVPGAYRLCAQPVLDGTRLSQRLKTVSPLPAKPPEGEHWSWAPTYFPSTVDIASAETIVMREGSELTGYEIRLRSAPVYRLSGVVSDDEGRPAQGVQLLLLSEIGWGPAEAQATSGEGGVFEFPSVRSGDWQITAEAKRGEAKWMGATRVMVAQRDVEGVLVRIEPPFAANALVEGVPQGAARIVAALEPLAGINQSSMASQQSDGTIKFEGVYAGRYRIALWSPVPGYYPKSFLLGTRDATGQDVELTPSSPPIRVIYKPNPARVVGKVRDGAGVKVVLIQTDQEGFIPGQSLRATVCDQEGRFSVEDLRPSAYYAFAFAMENVNSGAVSHAAFAHGLARQAKTVDLSEGETASLDLDITPWPE